MSFSNSLENSILNHVFGSTTYVPSATLYFGLSTTTPQEDGTGITEPSGNNYSRVAVTNNITNFPNTSTSSMKNGIAITFPQASGAWGSCTHWVMMTASSGGTMLAYGALTTPKSPTNGDTLSFGVNSLIINLD